MIRPPGVLSSRIASSFRFGKRLIWAFPGVNRKRVYWIMKRNNLLLPKQTGRPVRMHDGQIATLQSNMRWCSDVFEIGCWTGERAIKPKFSLFPISCMINKSSVSSPLSVV